MKLPFLFSSVKPHKNKIESGFLYIEYSIHFLGSNEKIHLSEKQEKCQILKCAKTKSNMCVILLFSILILANEHRNEGIIKFCIVEKIP